MGASYLPSFTVPLSELHHFLDRIQESPKQDNSEDVEAFRARFLQISPDLFLSQEQCSNKRGKLHCCFNLLTDNELKIYLETKLIAVEWTLPVLKQNLTVARLAVEDRQAINANFRLGNLLDVWKQILLIEDERILKPIIKEFLLLFAINEKQTKLTYEFIRPLLKVDDSPVRDNIYPIIYGAITSITNNNRKMFDKFQREMQTFQHYLDKAKLVSDSNRHNF